MITLLVVMTVVVLLMVSFFAGAFFEWKWVNKYCVLFGKTKKK